MSKRITSILIICIMAVSLVSCADKNDSGKYQVYFTDEAGTKLIEYSVDVKSDDSVSIAEELIKAMNTSPKNDYRVINKNNVSEPRIEIENGYAVLDFKSNYYDLSTAREVLYRSAIVKELMQIKDVKKIRFTVEGADLVRKDGSVVGFMDEKTFVDDTNNSVSDIQWDTVMLYFSNKDGSALARGRRKIAFSKNIPRERAVLEELIKGPEESGCYQSLPSNVTVLSVSVVDKICYVNLSTEFSSEMVNTKNNIPIYSIVNTLDALEGIDGVKIMVNGNSNILFRDSINLDEVFKFNSELVQ